VTRKTKAHIHVKLFVELSVPTGDVTLSDVSSDLNSASQQVSVTSRGADCARAAAEPEVKTPLKMSAERDLFTINFRSAGILCTSGSWSVDFGEMADEHSYCSPPAVGILLPVVCWVRGSMIRSDSDGSSVSFREKFSVFCVSSIVFTMVSVFNSLTKGSFSSPASLFTITLNKNTDK